MTVKTLSTRDATARAERIRNGLRSMEELRQDIADAFHARDWETLNYNSWEAYVIGEFEGVLPRLDRDQRRELVISLRAEGLSTRAIAAATGVHKDTVRSDLSGGENSPPADGGNVTGTDGKSYSPKRPPIPLAEPDEPEPEPAVPNQDSRGHRPVRRRTPLPKFAADKVNDLWRLSDALPRIINDDRFTQNREVIRQQCEALLARVEHNIRCFREAVSESGSIN